MARTSKNVLQRVKLNLAKLCDMEGQPGNQDHHMELLKWKSKYKAEIMDLCTVEIV